MNSLLIHFISVVLGSISLSGCTIDFAVVPDFAPPTSKLWGLQGELFDPHGRLPDFSYAGYEFGDQSIPEYRSVTSVKDFGADGSDRRDDTDAFLRAISSIKSGAIEIPEGEYFISDIIEVQKPHIVLRGAGSGKTVLKITSTLNQLRPEIAATASGQPVSRYSWSGGFLWVQGKVVGRKRFEITQSAQRGDTRVVVSNPEKFARGDRVQIEQQADDAETLLVHLYAGQKGDTSKLRKQFAVQIQARVVSVVGNTLVLNRPLRWDIRPQWRPTIRISTPTVHHVGIEGMTIQFEPVEYEGHFSEQGRNAISFNGTTDCWVRDVVIENCDSGIFFMGMQGTLDGITLRSSRASKSGRMGHHGISLGSDNILTNFNIQTVFYHDITMTRLSAGNVIKNGRGTNLTFDHHKSANFSNLFCNIDVGTGTQLWKSGGGPSLGRHTGGWSTFWGIKADQPIAWPSASFGPDMMNLVGLYTVQPESISNHGKWFEVIDPEQLVPSDLHAAQLEHRRALQD